MFSSLTIINLQESIETDLLPIIITLKSDILKQQTSLIQLKLFLEDIPYTTLLFKNSLYHK